MVVYFVGKWVLLTHIYSSIFPGAITESVVSDTVDFTIAASDFDFPRLSRAMQAANQHGIKEWGVNQTR